MSTSPPAVDSVGRLLGSLAIPTTVEGYAELLAWAEGYGQVGCFGVEGPAPGVLA